MISKSILKARIDGVGKDNVTPIFPISILKLSDGVNMRPGDPNYDIKQLAIESTSKRIYPNFANVDAPHLPKANNIHKTFATMGCVDGKEVVNYILNKNQHIESFKRFWDRIPVKSTAHKDGEHKDVRDIDLKIQDIDGHFTKVETVVKNNDKGDWIKLEFRNGRVLTCTGDHPLPVVEKGRTLAENINVGDKVQRINNINLQNKRKLNPEVMWLLGLIIRDGCYDGKVSVSLGVDECDIVERYKDILKKYVLHKSSDVKIIEQDRKEKGHYYDVNIIGEVKKYSERFLKIFSGLKKEERKIPDFIFTADKESKYAFLAGMIDADGYINNHNNTKSFCTVQIGSTNKEMSIQTGMLAQSLGFDVFIYENRYKKHTKLIRYAVEFKPDKHIIEHLASDKKKKHFIPNTTSVNNEYATVKNVEYIGFRDEYSYDVETESDTFVVSGIASHNCRTAMSEDRHGLDCLDGRGNVSPVTINLPKIALKHRMDLQAGYDINGFFKELKEVINVAVAALVERFEWQGKQLAKSAPFIYENGVLKGKKLDPNDNVREVLKHGSLALGYIGLSNALVALTGKHHGESKDVLDLGLRIIEMLDDAAKEASEKYDLNFSVYATPAEGLCDKWAKALRKEFGVVEGVTDRDYINNSHHVPVYHKCSIKEKLDIEQKFAKYATGGNITYVELDGNARTNLKALEEIIDYAMKIGIPYLALNHPIDECSNCGYEGIIGDHCPKCGKKDGDTYIKRLRRVN